MALRNWCFTINNYSEEEINSIKNWKDVTYCIFGKEVGEEGTHHLQGYVELNKKCRLAAMKKLNSRAHWEPRMGKQSEAINYCKKENDFVEIGEKKSKENVKIFVELEKWHYLKA